MKYLTKLLRNFRKISLIFFLQLNINDKKKLITSTFQAKSLKNVSNIQGTDKIQREIKIMSIPNKNKQLLFPTTFRCKKNLFIF